jgi:hypothetical protein
MNESDLPQFQGKRNEPVGTFAGLQPGPRLGPRRLTQKESAPMMKALKSVGKGKLKSRTSKKTSRFAKHGRRIESDNKVHVHYRKLFN